MAYRKQLCFVALALVTGCGGDVLGESGSGGPGRSIGFDGGSRVDTGVIGTPGQPGQPGQPGHPGQPVDAGTTTPVDDSGTIIFPEEAGGFDSGTIIFPEDAGESDSGTIISFPPPPDGGVMFHDSGVIFVDASEPFPDGGVIIFDGGFPVDSGPASTTIPCGGETCDSNTQACCVAFMGGLSSSCVPLGTSCSGASLTCTGSSNCTNGEVCCATLGFGGGGATCQASCGGGGFGGGIQLCTSDSDCPSGDNCQSTPLGISVCRPGHGGGGGTGPTDAGISVPPGFPLDAGISVPPGIPVPG